MVFIYIRSKINDAKRILKSENKISFMLFMLIILSLCTSSYCIKTTSNAQETITTTSKSLLEVDSKNIETNHNTGTAALQTKLKTGTKMMLKVNTFLGYFSEYSKVKLNSQFIKSLNLYSKKLFGYMDPKGQMVISGNEDRSKGILIARAIYNKSRYQTGWDKLNLKTYPGVNPVIQCFMAGFLEGALTSEEIYYYYKNIHVFFHGETKYIEEIKAFYGKIDQNLRKSINTEAFEKLKDSANENQTQQWAYIACLQAQLEGLHQGYNSVVDNEKKLSILDFYFINSEGNFGDLKMFMKINKLKIPQNTKFYTKENLKKVYDTDNLENIWRSIIRQGHCSAIVKMTTQSDGTYDILTGHNTWTDYCEMLRSLKHVDFAFEGNNQVVGMKPRKINYSSYPGVLFSGDDFYEIDSKIVLVQTTLSVLDKFQYKNILDVSKYIPEFMRIMISNFMADSGKDWVDSYSSYNNHMYITQWLVVDYKVLDQINQDKITNNNPNASNSNRNFLSPKKEYSGLVNIIEEVPGSILTEDITGVFLSQKYFGSFNLAYFPENQVKLGLNIPQGINFTDKSYNPRYYILQKLHGGVNNIDQFAHLLQYNGFKDYKTNFKDDPSLIDPQSGISSRADLESNPYFSGGVDFKIVNKDLMDSFSVYTYGGPTYDKNPYLSPFDFSVMKNHDEDLYHLGIPNVWNFQPIYFSDKTFDI